MIEKKYMLSWIDDELTIVRRNKCYLEDCLLVTLFPNLTKEISRYEKSLITLKGIIRRGFYDSTVGINTQ